MVQVFVRERKGDIGAARNFDVDVLRVVLSLARISADKEEEGENCLENKQGACRGGIGSNLDGAIVNSGEELGSGGSFPRLELEGGATDGKAINFSIGYLGEPFDGSYVLSFESCYLCQLLSEETGGCCVSKTAWRAGPQVNLLWTAPHKWKARERAGGKEQEEITNLRRDRGFPSRS